jgi:hypothetical protein
MIRETERRIGPYFGFLPVDGPFSLEFYRWAEIILSGYSLKLNHEG